MSKAYEELNHALVKAGLLASVVRRVKGCNLQTDGAVNILVNTRIDASPYATILLEYAPKLTVANEIEMVARCMSQSKGFRDAVPWLLSLFEGYSDNGLNGSNLWAIGLAIYTINNKEFYPDVIAICQFQKYGHSRQMLMGTLARAKTDEAYEVLVKCLDDPSVRAHAIEGLGRSAALMQFRSLIPSLLKKVSTNIRQRKRRFVDFVGNWHNLSRSIN